MITTPNPIHILQHRELCIGLGTLAQDRLSVRLRLSVDYKVYPGILNIRGRLTLMNNWSLIVRTPIAHSLPWYSLKRFSRAFSLLRGLVIGAQALVHLLLYSDAIFAVIKSVTIQIMWSVLYNYVQFIIMHLETMPYWTTMSKPAAWNSKIRNHVR